jgi:hypothetical protein
VGTNVMRTGRTVSERHDFDAVLQLCEAICITTYLACVLYRAAGSRVLR